MPRLAWYGLFGFGFFLFGINVMLSNQGKKPNYQGKAAVIAAAYLLGAVWLGLLVGRKFLLKRYDPNRHVAGIGPESSK